MKMIYKILIGITVVLLVFVVIVVVTQLTASTPPILNDENKPIEDSVAELISVKVNGRKEWLSIRGQDMNAPILLYLAGGPGGTQMTGTRFGLQELEKHFVVVGWDQPGSGKSYHCMNINKLKVNTYIEDGLAVTEYLQERFHKQQIYLMGESWGSMLGIFLIKEKPDYYAGFIGTGQMVDIEETEKMDYRFTLEDARKKGNTELVKKLEKQGEPLYTEGNVALLSNNYLGYLMSYMYTNPNVYSGNYDMVKFMFASEYGLWDTLNYGLGLMNTFNVVYPQLYETDLRETHTKVEVPVYFFEGRYDVNAPTSLVEDYYELLDAPKKEFIWFEHSAHCQWSSEPDKFISETVRLFLE